MTVASTRTALELARALVAHGFSVIPVDHPDQTSETDPKRIGKVPPFRWREFQSRQPTDSELQEWFGRGHLRNCAIVTGKVSGVVVVDGDSEPGLQWMDGKLPPTPMRTKTAKGEHWYYGHPGIDVGNEARIRTGDPTVKIDVRGDGGYAVAPGSKHVSGVYYEPLGTWPAISDLPLFESAWLLEVEAPPGEPHQPRRPRERHSSRVRALKQARNYLAHAPPAVEGDGGDTHTFSVCCALVRGFDLTDDDALDLLLSEWNASCRPPWSKDDLETKIRNAREHGTEAIGGRLRAFPYTEVGDAEYFADAHGDSVRFDHPRGRWLRLNEHGIWAPDQVEYLRTLVVDTMRDRQRDATAIPDADAKKRAFKWAVDGEASRRISNTLREARAMAPIADDGTTWDQHPWLLGTPAGVVDLQTGLLRPGRADERITMRTRAVYDPHATCSRWEDTLDQVFNGSDELIAFICRAFGYSITGDCSEECFFTNWGSGSNGKSTVVNTVAWVLGDYADDLPFSTLERNDRSAMRSPPVSCGKTFSPFSLSRNSG